MNTKNIEIQKLMTMLKAGTSAAMTVEESARQLIEAGFEELEFQNIYGRASGTSPVPPYRLHLHGER